VALADVYNDQGLSGRISIKEAYTKAREAIDHALSIDPNSAAAYSRLASIEENFRWDFEQGTAALKRATELDPAVETGDMAIWSAVLADRFDDGIALSRQGVQRDPLSAGRLEDLAIVLWWANQFPEAESTLRHLLELNSSFSGAHCELGEVLLFEHRADAALAIMSEETDQDGKWCVANALWALGRRTEADALLAEAKAKYGDTQALGFAQSYARRGEKDGKRPPLAPGNWI
jgi:tetratricopeptide (TPR) repeat protein